MGSISETRRRRGANCLRAAWIVAATMLLANGARAETPDEAQGSAAGDPTIHVAAESGMERLEEDYFLGVAAKLGMELEVPALVCREDDARERCRTRLRGGVRLPFRWRVIDRGGADESVWRRRDWDETGDYFKFLRRLEYGRPDEPLHARAGEIGSAVLGHGTIVNHYYNAVTPDHYRLGLEGAYEGDQGGGELLVGDLVRPGLLAGRAYVRPATFFDGAEWWRRLSVGMSLVGDVGAPVELRRGEGDSPVVGPTRRPEVERRRATAVGGVDLELQAVRTDQVGVTPYADFNQHFGLGRGLHAGLDLSFAPSDRLGFAGRAEYRMLGENYLPDYVGPLYEVDRFQLGGWGRLLPAPKLQVAAESGAGEGVRHGVYGELEARVAETVSLTGALAHHEGPDNGWARLGVQASIFERARLGAFYYRHGFETLGEILDGGSAFFVAESRVTVWGPVYAKGAYSRLWKLHDDGFYEPIDRWNLGAGVSFAL